ncbi:isochorismatase family cysteine hydrolase [Polaribacter staleyi]|uniref:cysteine hydrolase family protein n=1 Tax=Polaribacter staleyi TaxID=2022337 RepID=UPI0031BB5B9E
MKPALLIIDMQKAFLEGYCKSSMETVSPIINEAIHCFKEQGYPIILVQDVNEKEGAIPGKKGFDVIACLDWNKVDYTIHKSSLNCFYNTDCNDILQKENIDTVFLSGFCADYCVLASYKGALDNGYTASILREGIAAGAQKDIDKVVVNNNTISISLLKEMVCTK